MHIFFFYKLTVGYYAYNAHLHEHWFICFQPFIFSIADYLVLSLTSDIPRTNLNVKLDCWKKAKRNDA